MKIVNRGYLIIKPKTPFIDWSNQFDEEFQFDADDELEPNIYLIEEDFFDNEQVIRQNFKKVFVNELMAVMDDESTFPEIKEEVFYEWFDVVIGTTVFDGEKSDLKRFELD